jgi:hypothetical protein
LHLIDLMLLVRTFALLLALGTMVLAPGATVLADDPPVTIAIRDHQFVPSEVRVPANTKVELIIRNEQTTPAEFESASLHREKVVAPGSAASVFIGPLKPGRYEFFDDFNTATRGVLVVQ